MIGRLSQAADFQRLLAAPMRSRSAHFAVHHVPAGPSSARKPAVHASSTELSTVEAPVRPCLVDKTPSGYWLGCVLPKRHARRSVTRNLLRRQIRAVMTADLAQLPSGLWLVRLRAPYAREQFPSAASLTLRETVRAELQQLFARAAQTPRSRPD